MPRTQYQNTDLLGVVLEQENQYTVTRLQAYKKLSLELKKNHTGVLTQLLTHPLTTYMNLLKHHALATLALTGIVCTVLTGATAQALAPDEYKPTELWNRLFASNEVPDRNPYTSLAPDENHNVASLDECDLAIKYPKRISEAEIDITQSVTESHNDNKEFLHSYTLNPIFNDDITDRLEDPNNTSFGTTVACVFSTQSKGNFYQHLNEDRLFVLEMITGESVVESDFPNELSIQTITAKELQEKFGWFITESKLDNIQVTTGYPYCPNNMQTCSKETVAFANISFISFKKDDIEYLISAPEALVARDERNSLTLNAIQLQFNSTVKNEINAEVRKTTNLRKEDGVTMIRKGKRYLQDSINKNILLPLDFGYDVVEQRVGYDESSNLGLPLAYSQSSYLFTKDDIIIQYTAEIDTSSNEYEPVTYTSCFSNSDIIDTSLDKWVIRQSPRTEDVPFSQNIASYSPGERVILTQEQEGYIDAVLNSAGLDEPDAPQDMIQERLRSHSDGMCIINTENLYAPEYVLLTITDPSGLTSEEQIQVLKDLVSEIIID